MRSLLLRVLLLSSALAAAYAGSTYTPFEPEVREAEAQELVPEFDLATPTPTATAIEAPTPVPTEVAPPAIATIVIGPPAPTSTAMATATASPVATETPVPTPVLPMLEKDADPTGATVEATIDKAGGRIASSDGRVVIDVPKDAFPETLTTSITRRSGEEFPPPSSDYPLIGVWDFRAVKLADASKEIHEFDQKLTVVLRFTEGELAGKDTGTLKYWSLDEASGTWTPTEGVIDLERLTLTVQTDHFSTNGASASTLDGSAPLLMGSNVRLQTGSAALDIPIAVPPGRAGLAPELNLTYDSMRVEEMKQDSAVSGWAGLGWELGTGAIQIDQGPPLRVYLESAGFGGELLPGAGSIYDPPLMEGGYFVWRLRDENFVRIRTACDNFECPWYVTDKQGRQYVYGGAGADDTHRRWYIGFKDGEWRRMYYRLDLAYILDTSGNRIDFTYWRHLRTDPDCAATPSCSYFFPDQSSGPIETNPNRYVM